MNPYYKAWLSITGGGELYEYMIWISQKHREYQKIDNASVGYHERFGKWLVSQFFVLEAI